MMYSDNSQWSAFSNPQPCGYESVKDPSVKEPLGKEPSGHLLEAPRMQRA